MLLTELEWLLIDGSVGWSSGSCRRSDERQRLSCGLDCRMIGATSTEAKEEEEGKNWKVNYHIGRPSRNIHFFFPLPDIQNWKLFRPTS